MTSARRAFVLLLLSAGLLLSCSRSRPAIRNVLLISIDTLRADHVSAYGFPRPTTPNIDAVAREGVLFKNVHTLVPMTLPAHVSMLTGTLPPTHGLRDNLLNRLPEGSLTLAEMLKPRGFTTGAIVSTFVLDRRFGMSQGFDTYDDRFQAVHKIGDLSERKGDETTRLARDWLDEHKQQPFFLFVHFYDPHEPYEPPEPFASKWSAHPYEGEVAFADYCVGQVLEKLRQLGLYDDTLIVITGDHGEMLGEHGELNHGFFIYEGALRVPLVMRVPRAPAVSRQLDVPVSLIDIAPTIVSLVGAPVPKEVQGVDLSPWLAGRGAGGGARALYAETVTPTRYYGASSLLGVIVDGWKYIETTRPELYDLRSDPAEAVNLLAREPARADALGRTLVAILAAAGRAPGPAPEPAALDEASRQRLAALGYLGRSGDSSSHGFDRSKEDAKDLIAFFRKDQRLNKLVEDKNYPEARALCEEMLRQRPGFADCHLQMSKIAAAEGNLDAALTAARKAVAVGPKNERAHVQLAALLKERGDVDGAIAQLRQALALEPNAPDTRMLLGRALAEKGWLDEAAGLLGTAATVQPESAAAATQLGFVLAKQGKLQEAVLSYRRALALDPGSAEAHAYLGSALASQGHWDEAIEHFQAALKAKPENAELHDWMGVALRERGRTEEALGHFREAVRLASGLAIAHYNLGRALKQEGKLDEAVLHYRRALDINPRLAEAHNGLGSVLGSQGRLGEAVVEFREALRVKPDDAEAENNLGLALRSMGERDEALRHLRAALKLRPDWPTPMNEIAWILATHPDARIRNPGEAVRLAERAAERTARRQPVILDTLAAAYAAAGDFGRAAAVAQEAMSLAASGGPVGLSGEIGARLELYRQKRPFRETDRRSAGGRP
ncbi:MAG TPA: tetratricopeptide repeat protein [Gemmatimonadales bacterium]|nr:tetratricopeptide repeat protein [Gemmatimonadales bacterium]